MTGLRRSEIIARVDRAAEQGARAALAALRTAAMERTPVNSGRLAASARIDVAADGRSGAVGYTAPYAVYQHERKGLTHRRGESGYLANAARDAAVRQRMAQALAEAFRKELNG